MTGISAASYRGEASLFAAVAREHEQTSLWARRIGADMDADRAALRADRAWRQAQRAADLAAMAEIAPDPAAA